MIYLDNSATTRLCPEAKQRICEVLDSYGNPSSRHALGLEARSLVETARAEIAQSIGLKRSDSQRVIFTSSGTEANNQAIFGCAHAKERRRGNKIITTDSEHPSVQNVMKRLQSEGMEIIRLSTRGGVVDLDELDQKMDGGVMLVSVMTVNNETGAVYDTRRIFEIAKRKNPDVITHTDAVQGFLKVDIDVKRLGADLVTLSSHKIHGPKGVGALYISQEMIKKKNILPHLYGGGQEGGMRSGTENVTGIVGFGEAARVGYKSLSPNRERMIYLRGICEEAIAMAGAEINMPHGERAPHIVSLRLPKIKSEIMLNFLSARGICVSAGSACSSHDRHISDSLLGFGLTEEQADSTLRVSLSHLNTEQDIKAFGEALKCGISTLVRFKR